MVQIILEHPYLTFLAFCILVENITEIIKKLITISEQNKTKKEE